MTGRTGKEVVSEREQKRVLDHPLAAPNLLARPTGGTTQSGPNGSNNAVSRLMWRESRPPLVRLRFLGTILPLTIIML